MTMTSSSPSTDLAASLELVQVKPGTKFSLALLHEMLPDVETALFFGKVYELDAAQLGNLLHKVFNTKLTAALFAEGYAHSNDLQSYLVDVADQSGYTGPVNFGDTAAHVVVPKGEILPEVWASLEVEVASSIKEVATKLESVVGRLPGKQGAMVFKSLAVLNSKRPVLGDYRAGISHARQQENLLILDVSGSMNSATVEAIVEDVVALSYKANAHMAVVSNDITYWQPGSYGVDEILAAATYGGTHYETLAPLFDRDWGCVITVADYDSSYDAKRDRKSVV